MNKRLQNSKTLTRHVQWMRHLHNLLKFLSSNTENLTCKTLLLKALKKTENIMLWVEIFCLIFITKGSDHLNYGKNESIRWLTHRIGICWTLLHYQKNVSSCEWGWVVCRRRRVHATKFSDGFRLALAVLRHIAYAFNGCNKTRFQDDDVFSVQNVNRITVEWVDFAWNVTNVCLDKLCLT